MNADEQRLFEEERNLLRQGLRSRDDVHPSLVDAIAEAATAANTSPLRYLIDQGILAANVGRTLQAICKGYIQADAGTLLDDVVFPDSLRLSVDVVDPDPHHHHDDILENVPRWNSLDEATSNRSQQSSRVPSQRLKVSRPAEDAPSVGARVDTYTLRELLAVDPAAWIYRAYDERGRRSVLLRFLRGEVDTSQLNNRIRGLLGLTSPHLVGVLGGGEARGHAFVVNEYLYGISLEEHLAPAGPEEPSFLVKVALTASLGLKAAFAAGVQHCDIRPANLLLYAGDGRVKVSGFCHAANPGVFQYLAPEVLSGTAEEDVRSDMYSLGVSLYRAATGVFPLTASTRDELLRAQQQTNMIPVRTRIPTFPRQLAALIERLLAKDREQRYPSWSDVVTACKNIETQSNRPLTEAVNRAVRGEEEQPSLSTIYRKGNV